MVFRGKEAEKLLRELGLGGEAESKYHSKKVVVDGIEFDSQHEASRYVQLKMLLRAGEIKDLRRQVRYELIPTQYETFARYGVAGRRLKDGKRCIEKGVDYVADFVYFDNRRGHEVVEDTKGVRTDDYIIKRKLMLYVHGIRIKEI